MRLKWHAVRHDKSASLYQSREKPFVPGTPWFVEMGSAIFAFHLEGLCCGVIMRDSDVRKALHSRVLRDHHNDPNTLVLNELGLRHGACRVDVAVVNGSLHGYELKSDMDTLERLPAQVGLYGKVLDKATLVVGARHAARLSLCSLNGGE